MAKKQSIDQIPVNLIDQIENSRIDHDAEDLAELMTSMKQSGLLQPIGVVTSGKRFEIVFGNRRLDAARKLGWSTIPATIREKNSKVDKSIENAIENMQRVDISYAQQGRIFSDLMKQGLTASEIAARVGVALTKVRRFVQLYHDVPKEFRKKIVNVGPGKVSKKGKLPGTTAFKILGISKTARLTSQQTERLFTAAVEDEFKQGNVGLVAKLMRDGHEFEDALDKARDARSVTISLVMETERINKIEKSSGLSIHEYLYRVLAKEQSLGIDATKYKKIAIAR